MALFFGLAGGSSRLVAAPRPEAAPGLTASAEAEAILRQPSGPSAESLGLDAASFQERAAEAEAQEKSSREPVGPTGVSQVFQALSGSVDDTLGSPVAWLSVDAVARDGAVPADVRVVLLDPGSTGSADPDSISAAMSAVRDAAPLARLGLVGFTPEQARGYVEQARGGSEQERAAATLASVDLLALEPPRTASAADVTSFLDRSGRHGRRVLALVEVPRRPVDLPAWKSSFEGAVAAGVGIVLTGAPGGEAATEAAWREDVAAHQALGRRLGGIAYD